jgi:hypothetical protein
MRDRPAKPNPAGSGDVAARRACTTTFTSQAPVVILVPVPDGPSWTDILTAFGTVGAVIAAVGIALRAEWRLARRLQEEHERSDRLLAEEREHSREERRIAREREHSVEAHAVQVAMVTPDPGKEHMRFLAATVVNHGRFTIRRVDARFRSARQNPSLVSPRYRERVPGNDMQDKKLLLGMSGRLEGLVHDDTLSPWDIGLRFAADPIDTTHLVGAYPVVRWTDRWGTRWEQRHGEVRQVRDDEDWLP